MVSYLVSGVRDYRRQPIVPYARTAWEIFAVLDGHVRLSLPEGPQEPAAHTLWAFPPGHVHGWLGDGRIARVIVIHLETLPDPVGAWVRARGRMAMPLDAARRQRLRALHRDAAAEWSLPGLLTGLREQRVTIDLALFVGELARDPAAEEIDRRRVVVQRAMDLFTEHLAEGWSFEQVCRALAISPAQLRRNFHEVVQAAPREVFEELRFRRAKAMILLRKAKMQEIAAKCGYQSEAALSRAFKRRYRLSPVRWRGQRLSGRHEPTAHDRNTDHWRQ